MARRDLASGPIFRIDDIYPNYEEAVMRMVMMVMMMMMMMMMMIMGMMMMSVAKKCQTVLLNKKRRGDKNLTKSPKSTKVDT